MTRLPTAVSLLLLVLIPLSQAACRKPRAGGKKIIVLGIDGLDPGFLERHWADLPSLNSLRQRGDFRPLATSIPPQSPVAWSTFITGMDPGGHGIYDFVHRDPSTLMPFSSLAEVEAPDRAVTLGSYRIPLSSGHVKRFLRGKAFWQILGERQVPVTVIRMANNFPPLQCEGNTLAGMGTPDLQGTFGTFAFGTDETFEQTRDVPGGRIVRIDLRDQRAVLAVEGPENTLRKDRGRVSVSLAVDVDPVHAAALFEIAGQQIVLQQGEWSDWIRVRFPLIPGIAGVSGMFRIYLKQLKPNVQIYISPVNIDPANPELPISTPASYSRQLAHAIGPFYTQGIAEDTAALRAGVLSLDEYLVQSRLVFDEQLELLRNALGEFQEGLLFLHFSGVDQDSHILWEKHEQQLLATYRRADRAVRLGLEHAGNSTLIVMSDHGFSAFRRSVHLNTWLRKEGFLAIQDPGRRDSASSLAGIDWARTQAYSLGLNAIYLNLSGRERHGIVHQGREAQQVLDRLRERLLSFSDPESGERVVSSVHLAAEVYQSGDADSMPDLIVGWSPGYRSSWQAALGEVPGLIMEDNTEEWRGDHCIAAEHVPGVFLSNRKSRILHPQLQDITATVLAEFGISPARGMTGRRVF